MKILKNDENKQTLIALLLNSFLFIIKIIAGIISHSTVVISDAINSLGDILTTYFILIAVKITKKGPDIDHPFGHNRALPLSAYTVAIFTGMLGFEIISLGIKQINNPTTKSLTYIAFIVLIITIITKIFMSIFYFIKGKKQNNPAIKAISVDSRNDIVVSTVAIIGVYSSLIGHPKIEGYIAILMGLFLIYSAFKLGKENIDYLIGKSPSEDLIKKIEKVIENYPEILRCKTIKGHYVGNIIHLEIVIVVDGNMNVLDSHNIGAKLRDEIQEIESVSRVFIHINPDNDNYIKKENNN